MTDARDTGWQARLSRSALVVIDMQRAHFQDDALEHQREQLITHCTEAIEWARANGLPIINVRTEHRRDRSTWTLNMLADDHAFLWTSLPSVVDRLGVDVLVLAGVSTHTCVATTAAHAFAAQLEVVLVRDAIASHRPELPEITLDTLREEYRCPVLDADHLRRVTVR